VLALSVLQDEVTEAKERRIIGNPVLQPALVELGVALEEYTIRFDVAGGQEVLEFTLRRRLTDNA